MGKYTLRREKKEVFAGTLAEVYDELKRRAPGGNTWRALSEEYGSYSIGNPDGSERARNYDEHDEHGQRYEKALFYERRGRLVEIVKALGWQPVIKKTEAEETGGRFYADNLHIDAEKDGASFSLWIGYPDRTKTKISGNFPGRHHYGQKNPSINISYEREPEAAARDIARRFLPDFLAAWNEHQQKEAAANDHEARTLAAMRTVKGWDLHEREAAEKTIWQGLPEGVYSLNFFGPDYVRLDVRTTPEAARKILDILRAHEPKEEEAAG